MKMKLILSWFLVIGWMGVIFWFSGMTSDNSNHKSESTINKVIEETVHTTNKVGITDKHPSDSKMKKVVSVLNLPLRKCMHASIYFILALLLIHALRVSNVKINKAFFLALLISFLYAGSDEIHQLFVLGRTGQLKDVIIDTCGATIGCYMYVLFYWIFSKRKNYWTNIF